ncbi:MAG: DUF4097 family beta strand repeat-containing protein [Ginsengibacter sp.]
MKKYLFLLMLVNICVAVNAQNKWEKEPYLTKSFSGEAINQVMAETNGGNITVTGVDPSEPKVEVFVNQNNDRKNLLTDDELKSKINEEYDLDVSVNNNKLTVTAKPKHRITDWKRALNFSFKIYAPKNASADLKTSGGNISLSNLSGDKDFTTSGGNLNLDGLEGKTKGSTSGGNINLSNSKDDIDVTTSGGNINAEKSSGNIKIITSGGSINMDNLDGKIKAETSGGNVRGEMIGGDLDASTSGGNVSLHNLTCALKAGTSGGNVNVSMKTLGSYLSLYNSSGKISLEIPKGVGIDLKLSAKKISTPNIANFSGTGSNEEMKGTVNGGGVPVTVDAGGGRIDLTFN